MSKPLIVLHRRNKIEDLHNLPKDAWIEIDIDVKDGQAIVTHDALVKDEIPLTLEDFLPVALTKGVKGFIADCKRENAYRFVTPLFRRFGTETFFYLNEGNVQADITLTEDRLHPTAIRIWRFRPAIGVIDYLTEAKKTGMPTPSWVWLDCYDRGLTKNSAGAYLALDQKEARSLQGLGLRVCLCSPELYSHSYAKTYSKGELDALKNEVSLFRERVAKSGIKIDAVCTKFPALWS